ncbi:hypothetical protein SKAU_G00202900 [Synaphobranchus kaupii]|uniref:Uncharacterized protein n=1 Tax=Synaphobranchus kaupii TaxID=118154 RepID=A0A9Q1FFS3_SYNKA|nr:hypothetical protein SKAU_G00202900 [Synaphobranchus kaupii]
MGGEYVSASWDLGRSALNPDGPRLPEHLCGVGGRSLWEVSTAQHRQLSIQRSSPSVMQLFPPHPRVPAPPKPLAAVQAVPAEHSCALCGSAYGLSILLMGWFGPLGDAQWQGLHCSATFQAGYLQRRSPMLWLNKADGSGSRQRAGAHHSAASRGRASAKGSRKTLRNTRPSSRVFRRVFRLPFADARWRVPSLRRSSRSKFIRRTRCLFLSPRGEVSVAMTSA